LNELIQNRNNGTRDAYEQYRQLRILCQETLDLLRFFGIKWDAQQQDVTVYQENIAEQLDPLAKTFYIKLHRSIAEIRPYILDNIVSLRSVQNFQGRINRIMTELLVTKFGTINLDHEQINFLLQTIKKSVEPMIFSDLKSKYRAGLTDEDEHYLRTIIQKKVEQLSIEHFLPIDPLGQLLYSEQDD